MDTPHTFISSPLHSMDPKTHNCPTHMDTPHTFIGSPPHSRDPKTHNRPTHMDTPTGSPPHSMDPETHNCLPHMGIFIGSPPHSTSNALTSTHTPHNTGFPLQPNTEPLFPLYTPCPAKTRPKSTLVPSKWNELLTNYPDPTFTDNIVGMATHGARIGYRGPRRQIHSSNHASAL